MVGQNRNLQHNSLLNMKLRQIGMFRYFIFSNLSSIVKLFDYLNIKQATIFSQRQGLILIVMASYGKIH